MEGLIYLVQSEQVLINSLYGNVAFLEFPYQIDVELSQLVPWSTLLHINSFGHDVDFPEALDVIRCLFSARFILVKLAAEFEFLQTADLFSQG